MTLTPKIIMLGVRLAGISATALINEVAISWYPPTWHLADGRWGTYDPAGVRSCIGARLLAAIGDQSSAWRWYDCAKRLWDANALDGFNWRYWALVSAAGFTLLAAFGFALAVRFGRPPFRVVRGRKLLTGRPAKRALLEVTKQEAELSGVGLDLIPGLPHWSAKRGIG